MAIYARCTKCRRDNNQAAKICTACNTKLGTLFQVRVKDAATGKTRTKITPTLKLAKEVEAKFKVQQIEGQLFNKPQHREVSFERYLSHAKLHKKTWETDQFRWNKHIAGKDFRTRQGILSILKQQQDEGYAPATIHHTLKLIKRVYSWHIETGIYFEANPTERIKLAKYDNRVNNILKDAQLVELREYLTTWKNRRAALVILFALYTGRRRGEILSLRWGDIDWERRCITCHNTKNGTSISFPVNNSAFKILVEAKAIQISDLVFPCHSGKYFHISKTWQELTQRLNLTIRFHDLRHTYASLLASSGQVDIYALKTLLGHKDIKLTERYSHLSDSRLRGATEVLDKLF